MNKLALVSIAAILICTGFAQAWTAPQPVSIVNTSANESYPYLSFDGKSLYFTRRDGSSENIYQATRTTNSGQFTNVTKALDHGNADHVMAPWVSQDNLRMYYYESAGSWQMKISTRTSDNNPWTAGVTMSGFGSINKPVSPKLTQDELTVVFHAYDTGNGDLWMATRPNINSPFGNLRYLSEINTTSAEGGASISPDGLSLYFGSNRNGTGQIFKATRQSLTDQFSSIEHLSFFDSPYGSGGPSLSADGSTLFFSRGNSDGTADIYSSQVPEPASLILLGLGVFAFKKKFKS